MPQEFQVVRCFSCETFNVDIIKKDNSKWQCKLCGEKQSTKKIYGTAGSAKECREIVQLLNERRGEKANAIPDFQQLEVEESTKVSNITTNGNGSRWSKYLVNDQISNQE